jgi:hypothetical protein
VRSLRGFASSSLFRSQQLARSYSFHINILDLGCVSHCVYEDRWWQAVAIFLAVAKFTSVVVAIKARCLKVD